MKKLRTFLINTVILTATTLLMRTIGMGFSVYMAGKIGSAGVGLYELIMSVYTLSISFASSGIRLTTTRLVVDTMAKGNLSVRAVVRRCLAYAIILGTAAAGLLFTCSGWISVHWLGDARTQLSLQVLALSLPFLAMSACLGGYFTAVRRVAGYSMTQLAELVMKIILAVVFLTLLLPYGVEYACVAIVIGSCLSEVFSFVLAFAHYLRDCHRHQARRLPKPGKLTRRMLGIAVPDAVGSWARSLLVTAEHLLIPRGFRKSGASGESALATYGTIHGMVLPILNFPSAMLTALSSLLVPDIAECYTKGHMRQTQYIIRRSLRITLLFSIGTAGILYSFADELGMAIYNSPAAAHFIRLLAPVVPMMYVDTTVDGLLKGLGQQVSSMRYNIIDASLSVAMVYFLIPRYTVKGYIITIFASEMINFVLSIHRLLKVSDMRVHVAHTMVRPLISVFGAVMFTQVMATRVLPQAGAWTLIGITALFYLALLLLLGSITREDLHWVRSIFR